MQTHDSRLPAGSPFRDPPSRSPGESLRAERDAIIDENLAPWVGLTAFALAFALVEWLRWGFQMPPSPTIATVFAGCVVALFILRKLPAIRARLRRLRLGELGERHVADVLDQLKSRGYYVLHDIDCGEFNIDHVVVGRTGVFVIETKTRSKSDARRDVHVVYDGSRVLVDGRAMDRDPLRQARALADHVRKTVTAATALRPPVRPVVLFPGWYVKRQPKNVEVWVLSPKPLLTFILNERVDLPAQQVLRIVESLKPRSGAVRTVRS